ncbi:MAG: hypothetical protein LUG93_13300 [Lachnospiraceae bacterium]|nr:hypothetical protein [Lachnospiraceae bacterium]
MNTNTERTSTELGKMKKWGHALDKITQIVGKVMYVLCILGGVLILVNMFGFLNTTGLTVDLTCFGHTIHFQELSHPLQITVSLLMITMLAITCIMVRALVHALGSVFQSIANGRPFENSVITGFRKAALWIAIISVGNGKIWGLIIAALCLFLSYVFHYGMLLQQESDETL